MVKETGHYVVFTLLISALSLSFNRNKLEHQPAAQSDLFEPGMAGCVCNSPPPYGAFRGWSELCSGAILFDGSNYHTRKP